MLRTTGECYYQLQNTCSYFLNLSFMDVIEVIEKYYLRNLMIGSNLPIEVNRMIEFLKKDPGQEELRRLQEMFSNPHKLMRSIYFENIDLYIDLLQIYFALNNEINLFNLKLDLFYNTDTLLLANLIILNNGKIPYMHENKLVGYINKELNQPHLTYESLGVQIINTQSIEMKTRLICSIWNLK